MEATMTAAERQKELRPVVEQLVEEIGGWSLIRARDIARIVMYRKPEVWPNIVAADQALSVFFRKEGGGSVSGAVLDALDEFVTELRESPDPRARFFESLREASGLLGVPIESETGWPFRVELVSMEALFADDTYQRPLDDNFIRKTVLAYEEPLVGVIDVADVGNGRYAIMDGRQRHGASALVGKAAMWAAIYENLTIADQARFFHHKNRDRKNVHPYYHFRARAVAGDPDANAINKIVKRHGYQLGIPALQDDVITAIRAVEEVFGYSSDHRDNALDPTLERIHKLWFGVKGGKDGVIIRGFGRFFAAYGDDEIQWQHLEDALAAVGPMILQGRAKELTRHISTSQPSIGLAVARAICTFHNTGLDRNDRLNADRLLLASPRS